MASIVVSCIDFFRERQSGRISKSNVLKSFFFLYRDTDRLKPYFSNRQIFFKSVRSTKTPRPFLLSLIALYIKFLYKQMGNWRKKKERNFSWTYSITSREQIYIFFIVFNPLKLYLMRPPFCDSVASYYLWRPKPKVYVLHTRKICYHNVQFETKRLSCAHI